MGKIVIGVPDGMHCCSCSRKQYEKHDRAYCRIFYVLLGEERDEEGELIDHLKCPQCVRGGNHE